MANYPAPVPDGVAH